MHFGKRLPYIRGGKGVCQTEEFWDEGFHVQADALEKALPVVYLYLCHPYPTVAASAHSLYLGILQVAEDVSAFTLKSLMRDFFSINLPVHVSSASSPQKQCSSTPAMI